MHFGIGALGTSACVGIYVIQKSVLTSTYTSVTHSLQGVHTCVCAYIYVYACICMWIRMCVYDIA